MSEDPEAVKARVYRWRDNRREAYNDYMRRFRSTPQQKARRRARDQARRAASEPEET